MRLLLAIRPRFTRFVSSLNHSISLDRLHLQKVGALAFTNREARNFVLLFFVFLVEWFLCLNIN
jgi:uncharacterized membrane protein